MLGLFAPVVQVRGEPAATWGENEAEESTFPAGHTPAVACDQKDHTPPAHSQPTDVPRRTLNKRTSEFSRFSLMGIERVHEVLHVGMVDVAALPCP
jgi:hypothetical protein